MAERGGYVYAIGIDGTTLVKIGHARNVEKRLQALQIGMPYRLKVLYVRWETQAHFVEKALHRLVQPWRQSGEWFDVEASQLEAVMQMPIECPQEEPVRDLSERLLIARRRRKMTQQALADKVGVNKATIFRIEKGISTEISVEILRKIALTLGVSADFLLGLAPDDEEDEAHAAVAGR